MSNTGSGPITRWAGLALGLLFVLAIARLAQLEQAGPAHSTAALPGGLPTTLYLPGPNSRTLTLPPPPAERPPAIVLIHGFLVDRSFSPERLLIMVIATLLVLPFWLAFELLVRRGTVPFSTTVGLLGRTLILVLIGVGASLQILPGVLMLVLPSLAILMVTMEIFAASAYSTSHNLALIALVDSLWLAWSVAATNPITFTF
jgi:hypothetical protein